MVRRDSALPATLLCLLALSPAHARATAATPAPTGAAVTVFRCVDSRGQLVALRDSPCPQGETQQIVQMQRPRDPPPRPAAPPPPPSPPPPQREVRIVTVQPPQPMFECTAPDGSTYLSESSDGEARWAPQWAFVPGWPSRPGAPGRPPGRPPVTPPVRPPWPPVRPPSFPGTRPPGVVVPAGGNWVRDPCVRLPQGEICRRFSDRRFEILRIYHAAMPSGRAELDRELRLIDERMANACPSF
jgi:hypothetical protein